MDPDASRRRRPGKLADLAANLQPARAALARELRRGRENADLSLSELAHRTYSSKATVSRWLNGQSLPDERQAACWARACGTDPALMIRLRAAAGATRGPVSSLPAPEGSPAAVAAPDPAPIRPAAGSGRRFRPGTVPRWGAAIGAVAAAVVLAAIIAVALVRRPHSAACAAAYPVHLEIPAETGPHVEVSVEAACTLAADRAYRVVEEVLDVDPGNPHPAYYVKADVPYLRAGQVSTAQFTLGEPVGTRADFFVISVDNGGLRALGQNQVADNGLLFLPPATRRVSRLEPHRRIW
jgi:transcriptional regulator with XRE-family HTH domain